MRESVKSSIALDAAVRSHTKRRQHVSLDKTTPMQTENLLNSAAGAGTIEGTVHFRFLGAFSNGRRHLINGEPIGDVHSLEYPVVRRIDGERTVAPSWSSVPAKAGGWTLFGMAISGHRWFAFKFPATIWGYFFSPDAGLERGCRASSAPALYLLPELFRSEPQLDTRFDFR